MMTNRLYHMLMEQIEQILPDERVTRRRGLAWLLTGSNSFSDKQICLHTICQEKATKRQINEHHGH